MKCFPIYTNEVKGRIDPHFYRPEFKDLDKKIKQKKIKLLGDCVTFQYGLGESAQKKGDIVYIRITDIDNFGNLKKDNLAYLDFDTSFKNYKLQKGDILVARTGATFGKSYLFNEDFNAVFAGYLIRININDFKEINPKYLFYFMQTRFYWLQANRIMTGGGQPQFNVNTIKQLKIILPSKETQNKVIQLMDKAYSQKKKKESEAQKLLDSINDYILSDLGIKLPELKDKMTFIVWDKDVKNKRTNAFFYQPKFKKVEKALRKGKFNIKTLEQISIKIINGLDFRKFTDKGAPYIRVSNIKPNYIDLTDIKFVPDFQISKNIKLNKDDLLITRKGTYGVAVAVDIKHKDIIISSEIFKITLKKNINSYYIANWLNTNCAKLLFEKIETGGIMGHISQENLKTIQIPIPPLKIQKKLTKEVMNRISKAIKLNIEAKEVLEKTKKKVENIIIGD